MPLSVEYGKNRSIGRGDTFTSRSCSTTSKGKSATEDFQNLCGYQVVGLVEVVKASG